MQAEHDGKPVGPRWRITDELYNYRANPRGRVQVIATVDERGYDGGLMGADHPIAWCHAFDGGRSWYTGLGHDAALYRNRDFLAQLRQAKQRQRGGVKSKLSFYTNRQGYSPTTKTHICIAQTDMYAL